MSELRLDEFADYKRCVETLGEMVMGVVHNHFWKNSKSSVTCSAFDVIRDSFLDDTRATLMVRNWLVIVQIMIHRFGQIYDFAVDLKTTSVTVSGFPVPKESSCPMGDP